MAASPEECTVFVKCVDGIDNIQLKAALDTPITSVERQIREELPESVLSRTSISTIGGINIRSYKTIRSLYEGVTDDKDGCKFKFIEFKLNICLCGGKGGFGQLLKAKAHSMSKSRKSRKSSSKDLYKTLDGRRVKTIKKLRQIDDRMSTMEDSERAKLAEKRAKLQRIVDLDLEKNVKFENTKLLDHIDSQLEEIRQAVSYGDSNSSDEELSDESDTDYSDDDDDDDNDEHFSMSTSTSETMLSSRRANFTEFFDEIDAMASKKTSKSRGKEIQN